VQEQCPSIQRVTKGENVAIAALRERYAKKLVSGFYRVDNVVEIPILPESHFVKKTQRGNGDENGTGSQLSLVGQIDLVGPNFLAP
jgi:hypothetical protein